jgi:RecB family exonuclease
VITARRTRLHRAPTLPAFRAALAALVPVDTIDRARDTFVLVPTRSAGQLLRRTMEDRALRPGTAIVLPDVLTRRDWYERLHQRTPGLPRLLTPFEREVLVEAAAHEAITEGDTPPFNIRPALLAEILDLYDGLRGYQQTLARFEDQLTATFSAAADYDRGAERLLRQTRFLVRTLQGYEQRVAVLGELDEHRLRDILLETPSSTPYRAAIVAVGDQAQDPNGLPAADFDLLTRLPGLEAVDFVATEEQLASGLYERLHNLLPGLEDTKVPPPEARLEAPVLLVPEQEPRATSFLSRDREDELSDLVRRIRALHSQRRSDSALDRVGVVVGRPLPYVYLARGVFASGGVPLQSRDALPLAAEPFAAALDLIFSAVSTGFAAGPVLALLRSPHFLFRAADLELSADAVAALGIGLAAFDHGGDAARLESLATGWESGALEPPREPRWNPAKAAQAARTAAAVVRALSPLAIEQPASALLTTLSEFLGAFGRPIALDDPLRERHLRARRAVLAILDGLSTSHRDHHDLRWKIDELAGTVRRWIESETFTPQGGEAGVLLVDRAAAPFGDFDDLHLVGLVEGEWPARLRRNVFFGQGILKAFGWPDDTARAAAERASFVDLMRSPRAHVSLSGFSLEEDSLVDPSSLLDEAPRAGLSALTLRVPATDVFAREALALRPVPMDALEESAASWARLRASRPDFSQREFHGYTHPPAARAWSVSALDLYGQCPFKFYARYVLKLGEEREEEDGLTPLERGRLIHEVFETFYREWQDRGHRSVTADHLDQARALAEEVLARHLDHIPASLAAIERTRFLGSPVAPGLIDVVLRMEAEREVEVVERWLEHKLEGVVALRGPDGTRDVSLRGIADRVDLLSDGTFRVIDYKTSRASGPLQIALYATALRQRLAAYRGRAWVVGEAAYVAFRDDPPVKPLARTPADLDAAIAREEARALAIVEGIESGEFPPRPAQRSLCNTCAWDGVCRKDYVEADQPEPAV